MKANKAIERSRGNTEDCEYILLPVTPYLLSPEMETHCSVRQVPSQTRRTYAEIKQVLSQETPSGRV